MPRRHAADRIKAADVRRQAFVDAFLGEAHFSPREAARAAGFAGTDKTLSVRGAEMLRDPRVQELLRQRAEQAGVRSSEALSVLVRQMRGDMGDFVTTEGPVAVDLAKAREANRLGLLKRFKHISRTFGGPDNRITETQVEIELYDAQAAAAQLTKCLGLSRKKVGREQVEPDPRSDEEQIKTLVKFEVPRRHWPPELLREYDVRRRAGKMTAIRKPPRTRRKGEVPAGL